MSREKRALTGRLSNSACRDPRVNGLGDWLRVKDPELNQSWRRDRRQWLGKSMNFCTPAAGVVYRMDENDRTDHALGAVLTRFVKTPGAATYQALLRLQSDPNCPLPSTRLRALAEDRAVQDSESAPWVPSEALAFEQHHETAPRTAKEPAVFAC